MCVYLDYEIKFLNDNIISILYKGMDGCMVKGLDGAAMTTTIDLQTEKIIEIHDIVTDVGKMFSLLMRDQFQSITLWEGVAGSDLISEEFEDERGTWLMDSLQGDSKEHSCIGWYTDGKNLVIVSTSPLGGEDYNEYAASLNALQGVISEEFLDKLSKIVQ